MSNMRFVFDGKEVKYKYSSFLSSNGTLLSPARDPFPDQPIFHFYHSLEIGLQQKILLYLCRWDVVIELMELYTDKVLEVVLPCPYATVGQLKQLMVAGTDKDVQNLDVGFHKTRWNDSRSVIEYIEQDYRIPRFHHRIPDVPPKKKRCVRPVRTPLLKLEDMEEWIIPLKNV